MAVLELTIAAKLDGVPVSGFPLVRRAEVDEVQGFKYERVTGGGYTALPTDQLAEVNALVLRAIDQAITVRLANQSDAGLVLNAGGILIIAGATINSGPTTNVRLDNNSGSVANLDGVAGGT